ncbi:Uncharacterised protein [Sphingobacterium mizutaii]|uniref:Uncharacterized protein n=1 Tax=Sphingobacterium mizutaii TaxID=1010 RepID=A0AAJ4X960_9SPHI|nr:hypothetical protein SAMN05192578_10830 [Sphingobacterium mizutaii]SNV42740.1 Uncharacterised protein [Sphingobacterium mizutaii]
MGRAYSIRPYSIEGFPATFDHNHGLSSNLLNPGIKPDLGLSSHPVPSAAPKGILVQNQILYHPLILQTSIVGQLFSKLVFSCGPIDSKSQILGSLLADVWHLPSMHRLIH